MSLKTELLNLMNRVYNRDIDITVRKIRDKVEDYKKLNDSELLSIFNQEREKENKDKVVIFALITVAIERTLKMSPYDVQIKGGLVLADGNITEMKTGEGKTLTSLYPIIYHACYGQVCAITVNNHHSLLRVKFILKTILYMELRAHLYLIG